MQHATATVHALDAGATEIKGYGNKRNDGLVFSAWPKATTPRYEIERKFREHVAQIGGESTKAP